MHTLVALLHFIAFCVCCVHQVDSQTKTKILEVNGRAELIFGSQVAPILGVSSSSSSSSKHVNDNGDNAPQPQVMTESNIDHRARVGPRDYYDLVAAGTFGLLASLGLREHHRLLDIGCGSLRNGRLLIPYLNAGSYVGIEPNAALVQAGVRYEIGQDLVTIKRPKFVFAASAKALSKSSDDQFNLAVAQSVFSHTYSDLLSQWLAETSAVLREDGALVATFSLVAEDSPGGETGFSAAGWTDGAVFYKESTVRRMASAAGFTDVHLLDHLHPLQNWVLLAKRDYDAAWFTPAAQGGAGGQLSWNGSMRAGLWEALHAYVPRVFQQNNAPRS